MRAISNLRQLALLRAEYDFSEISLDLTQFLRGNLALYAIRSSLWSLSVGGRLTIKVPTSRNSVSFIPGRWTFQFVTQLAAKACDEIGVIIVWDIDAKLLVIERTGVILQPGPWSAAIIYSGSSVERNLLLQCAASLRQQPEISNGGQLLVCGPMACRDDVIHATGAEYLDYDAPEVAGRFLIGAKKMAAIAALRNERVLVCHTRITMRPEGLSKMPREFDMITPAVWVRGTRGPLPYIDLGFFDSRSVALYSPKIQPTLHYDRRNWMQNLESYFPYIDGGLFCIRRKLAQRVSLSGTVAWGEGEDAEWSLRLLHEGKLLELAPDVHADSLTCKTKRYAKNGHRWSFPYIKRVVDVYRGFKARLVHMGLLR
jgi:hypothetical protein